MCNKNTIIICFLTCNFFLCKAANIIFILADDLGYGDLGFSPFNSEEFRGIQTPNLRRMAQAGLVLTNFHTASPICSPSRASILTGLFPWRLGIDFIYSQDKKKDGSEELDHEQLPLLQNIPMTLRDLGLYTAHVGKWHLGGMTQGNAESRLNGNCSVPGINQYGFDEYVAMSEGFNSMRYWTQQRKETYAKGADYLLRNDQPLSKISPTPILTDKQTDEAIRVIREQSKAKRPFFLNLWFDAPHSPWEAMEPFFSMYQSKSQFPSELHRRYASMVTNMDMNIGRLLDVLDVEGLSKETLVFFTSDNGPEMDVGSPGNFRGRKRLLTEGGIRVPAIAMWPGQIPAGSSSDAFLLTTDLFPTLVSAVTSQLHSDRDNSAMPANLRIDGFSFLPVLKQPKTILRKGDERVVLFYTHSIGFPKFTAAISHGYKLLWADYEGRKGRNLPPSWRIFDLYNDAYENTNILASFQSHCQSSTQFQLTQKTPTVPWQHIKQQHQIDPPSLVMLRHMQLLMYLFRFDGNRDWLFYHENKPFETSPSCAIRTLFTAESLPTFSHISQPQFCGISLVQQEATTGCICHFAACERLWLSSEDNLQTEYSPSSAGIGQWTDTYALAGTSYFAPAKGSLNSYVQNVLKWSHFNDLCPNAQLTSLFDVLTRSSHETVAATQHLCLQTAHQPVSVSGSVQISENSSNQATSASPLWLSETLYAQGDFTGHQWRRHCHQRIHLAQHGTNNNSLDSQYFYYLRSSTCAQDLPLLQVNIVGMPRAVNICPESLERLMSPTPSENFMDDNLLLGLLNLVLLNVVGAKGDEDITLRPRSDRSLGVIDPHFFHLLSTASFASDWTSMKNKVHQLWGLLSDWERRVAVDCKQDCLRFTIWPWPCPYQHHSPGFWAITIAFHPVTDTQHNTLQLVHILPASSNNVQSDSSTSSHFLTAISLVNSAVTEFLRQARKIPDADSINVASDIVQSSSSGLIPSLETMKVIILLKLIHRSLHLQSEQFRKTLDSIRHLEKKLTLSAIFSERKKLIDFIIFQGREAFQQHKKAIKFMSAPKFDLEVKKM